jgi:hypothetical protein
MVDVPERSFKASFVYYVTVGESLQMPKTFRRGESFTPTLTFITPTQQYATCPFDNHIQPHYPGPRGHLSGQTESPESHYKSR